MKVYPFKIPKPKENSLIYQEDRGLVFYDKLHQHEEIQLSFIERGEGNLLLMNSFTKYNSGDFFVIGSQAPHVYRSTPSKEESVMLSIFFTEHSLGDGFFKLQEMQSLHQFFKLTDQGFRVTSKKEEIKDYFYQFKNSYGPQRISVFILLLQLLSECKKEVLTSYPSKKNYTENEGRRMSDVFTHTMGNYEKDITLKEISGIANMSKNAFCRYFKQRTNKTYFEFLIEIRVAKVCELLISNHELTITQVADICGFKNISNFNRQFKALKNMNPTTFRKRAFQALTK